MTMKISSTVSYSFFCSLSLFPLLLVHGFHSPALKKPWLSKALRPSRRGRGRVLPHPQEHQMMNTYGRGAEIWPEPSDDSVQLSDSFPNGQIPYSVIMTMDQQVMASVHETFEQIVTHDDDDDTTSSSTVPKKKRRRKRRMVSNSIRRILRRAAAKEEYDSFPGKESNNPLDKTPMVIAFGLVARGLIRPLDILLVAVLSFYTTVLHMTAAAPRRDNNNNDDNAPSTTSDNGIISAAPILPALPPQGHVPTMVSNPLGMSLLYSKSYDIWLKGGVMVGLIGPLALLTRFLVLKEYAAARLCARPIFLLACQAITEAISRRVMAPLPLRILIPLLYNTARLGYVWNWVYGSCCLCTGLGLIGHVARGLAVINLGYAALNLFAFLIPIATMRYMRAHFFGVEASEVHLRIGMEETLGLVPHASSQF